MTAGECDWVTDWRVAAAACSICPFGIALRHALCRLTACTNSTELIALRGPSDCLRLHLILLLLCMQLIGTHTCEKRFDIHVRAFRDIRN